MAQLGQRLGLDLTNTLTRNAKFATNFLERTRMTVNKAKAKLNNLALTIGQTIEDLRELLLKHRETRRIGRNDRLGVLDEVA